MPNRAQANQVGTSHSSACLAIDACSPQCPLNERNDAALIAGQCPFGHTLSDESRSTASTLLLHNRGQTTINFASTYIVQAKPWSVPLGSNRWLVGLGVKPETLAMLVMAGAAAPLGLALLRQSSSLRAWPVGRWGYWFYPGHLAVLSLLSL
jgi:hypothetical protein